MKKLAAIVLGFTLSFSLLSRATTIVFVGDSLTEGYGVKQEQAFPALLEQRLKKDFPKVRVINAGVSGATTAGVVGRIRWQLKNQPDIVVLGLGSNDGLRGQPVKQIEKNLVEAIQFLQDKKVKVLLLGNQMPPNYTPSYTKEFRELYPRVAKNMKIPLVPFLLEGVAGDKKLNQTDAIHPNEQGHQKMADNVYPKLKEMLK